MYVQMPLHLACKCMCSYIFKKNRCIYKKKIHIYIKTSKRMYRCPCISHANVCTSFMNECMCVCVRVFGCVYECAYIHLHIYMYECAYGAYTYTYIHIHICKYMYTYIYICTHNLHDPLQMLQENDLKDNNESGLGDHIDV